MNLHDRERGVDPPEEAAVERVIAAALEEDVGTGDITTLSVVPPDTTCTAVVIAKEEGIVGGLVVAEKVFRRLDDSVRWRALVAEGERVEPGCRVAEITGRARPILSAERTALNIVGRISGIATLTSRYVAAAAPWGVKILDTRKTPPGLRALDKYAVRLGGGTNHRAGLYDGVLIKDNHIRIAGSIAKAVEAVRSALGSGTPVEVEAQTEAEVEEALAAGADVILLDNMDTALIKRCVRKVAGRAKIEVSGGMTLEGVREVASLGVDYISVGRITHSAPSLDVSMDML